MKTFSTTQVARMIGIHPVTFRRWVVDRKVRASVAVPMDGRTLWRWTQADVERVRKYKQENYRKGRGRKPKPKR